LKLVYRRCYSKEKIPETIDEAFEIMKDESENDFYFKISVSILAQNISNIEHSKLLS
jgi:hypothetical protein